MTEHNVNINGIDVTARYTDENIRDIFLPLLKKLTLIQKEKGSRVLAMLAAPPGAGKSTLLSFLEYLARQNPDIGNVQTIGMDGFHRKQEYLLSHTAIRDGKEIRMVDIKGSPITFDFEKLETMVKRVASGDVCGWPVYDRHLHNPVENAIQVTGDIVILEGNYLLLDEGGWRNLQDNADYTIMIKADEELLRRRLISRRVASGHPAEDAESFVEFSDLYNARSCLEHSRPADLTLYIYPDDSYIKL